MISALRMTGAAVALPWLALQAAPLSLHSYERVQISPHFWAEGASFGDFNKDGLQDVVAGPYWYAGPDFTAKNAYAPANQTFVRKGENGGPDKVIPGFEGALGVNNAYSNNFFAFSHDLNADGWDDIVIIGFPGAETSWYENPRGRAEHWQRHIVFTVTDNESPHFTDLTGDGKPELVCNSEGFLGYAAPDWSQPDRPWTWHKISPKGKWQRFTHGLGVGDVNGDGRKDLLEAGGWWEQPASLAGDPIWKKHPFRFGAGGAQMYAYDFDGDGDNDVLTSLAAHGYGLAWYEQIPAADGGITFNERIIMNREPHENRYGLKLTQMHAVNLADFDNDGVLDILTGKRFWAHGPKGDPEPGATPVLYWLRTVRLDDGGVDFVPHLIDDASGVGTEVDAQDIDGDGYPEVVVGNKRGAFVFRHRVRPASPEEWRDAQPKPLR